MISRSASRRAYRSSWPNGRAWSRATSSRTAPPTREKSSIWASRLHIDARGSVARWSSACSRNLPGWASARCISKCGHRTRRPGGCTSRSASARSRAGRITTGARSRTRWFCGLPLLQRGGLQNFSTSGVSLIDRMTCGSYTVVALGPDPPSVWRSVVSRSLNKVMLIGNLGADPEVRSTNNGSRVATLSLATSRQWTGQGGEKQEKTEWHRVICWNNKGAQLADLAEKYMKKGNRIYVEGRVEYRTWEDREKQTRYTTEIIAREVILLSSREGGEGSGDFARAKAAAKVAPEGGGKAESLDAFPEALDEEDDDLPFSTSSPARPCTRAAPGAGARAQGPGHDAGSIGDLDSAAAQLSRRPRPHG